MVGRFLPVLRTMAIEAVDPLGGVPAAFELVDDGRGFAAVTLGTFAGCPHESDGRLIEPQLGTFPVKQQRRKYNPCPQDQSDKNS